MNEKDNQAKLDELRKAHEADPADTGAAVALAQFYADLGWLNEALDLYRELVRTNPGEFSLLLDYGNTCFRKQDFVEAERIFSKLTVLKPDRIEGWNNLGIVKMNAGREDDARRAFEHVLELEPGNAGAMLNLGNCHQGNGDLDKAAEMFQQAVRVSPDFADAWFNLGNVLCRKEEYQKAVDAYTRALRYNPEFASGLKNLGFAYEKMGDAEHAEEHYRKALACNRADAALYSNMAALYAKQGRNDEAKDLFLRAVTLAPKDIAGWMGLRYLSLVKGDVATYVKATQAVLAHLEPGAIAQSCAKLRELGQSGACDEILGRADALEKKGDELDAERLLSCRRTGQRGKELALERKLSGLASTSDPVREALAEYYCAKGLFDKVIAQIRGVSAASHRSTALLARALLGLDKASDAEAVLRTYLGRHEDWGEGWYLMARALLREGAREQAHDALVKAFENGADDTVAGDEGRELRALLQSAP